MQRAGEEDAGSRVCCSGGAGELQAHLQGSMAAARQCGPVGRPWHRPAPGEAPLAVPHEGLHRCNRWVQLRPAKVRDRFERVRGARRAAPAAGRRATARAASEGPVCTRGIPRLLLREAARHAGDGREPAWHGRARTAGIGDGSGPQDARSAPGNSARGSSNGREGGKEETPDSKKLRTPQKPSSACIQPLELGGKTDSARAHLWGTYGMGLACTFGGTRLGGSSVRPNTSLGRPPIGYFASSAAAGLIARPPRCSASAAAAPASSAARLSASCLAATALVTASHAARARDTSASFEKASCTCWRRTHADARKGGERFVSREGARARVRKAERGSVRGLVRGQT